MNVFLIRERRRDGRVISNGKITLYFIKLMIKVQSGFPAGFDACLAMDYPV
jgi:hypothetical protein